jgi:hypothetical protein
MAEMPEFIENPRRTPRAPVRCRARIALREGAFWSSPTSDYGPRGCQVVAPEPLTLGTRIFLELANDRIDGAVEVTGRVAWCSRAPPWRAGVAFDEGSLGAACDFFDLLASVYPGLDSYARAPERIPADAHLAPALPGGPEPLLTDDEARVLRAVGAGRSAGDLREAFRGAAREPAVNALFALLGRRYVVVGPADGEAAAGWAVLLAARRGADIARAEVALR